MKTFLKLAFIGSCSFASLTATAQQTYTQQIDKTNQCNWSSINNNIDSPERRKQCAAKPDYVLCMDAKMGSRVSTPDQIPDDHLREMISMCSQSTGMPTLNTGRQVQREERLAAEINTQQKPDIQIRELPPIQPQIQSSVNPQIQTRVFEPRELQANGPLSKQYIKPVEQKPVYDNPPQSSASRSTDPLDLCYENKIKKFDSSKESKAYEARMGFTRGINQDQIDEWKRECSRTTKKVAKDSTQLYQECFDQMLDAYTKSPQQKQLRAERGFGTAVSNEQIQEWQNSCKQRSTIKKPRQQTKPVAKFEPDEKNEKKNDVYAKIEACIDQKIGKSKPSNTLIQQYSQQCESKYNKPSIIDVPVSRVESTYSKGERNVKVQLEIKI